MWQIDILSRVGAPFENYQPRWKLHMQKTNQDGKFIREISTKAGVSYVTYTPRWEFFMQRTNQDGKSIREISTNAEASFANQGGSKEPTICQVPFNVKNSFAKYQQRQELQKQNSNQGGTFICQVPTKVGAS